jgi:hypothetical protein
MQSHGGMIPMGKTKELGEKPDTVPLCPPQIPQRLTWMWTQASMVRGQWLTAWAMAQPPVPMMCMQQEWPSTSIQACSQLKVLWWGLACTSRLQEMGLNRVIKYFPLLLNDSFTQEVYKITFWCTHLKEKGQKLNKLLSSYTAVISKPLIKYFKNSFKYCHENNTVLRSEIIPF